MGLSDKRQPNKKLVKETTIYNMNSKQRLKSLLTATFGLGLILTACSDENPWGESGGEGTLRLRLETSSEVQSAIPTLTRAEAPDVPTAEEFAISAGRLDGTWSKNYSNLDEFNNEASFKTGAYTLTASYGSMQEEGFGKPFYTGSAQVSVLEDRTSEVNITATLANCMVSIDYTEAFKDYFNDWSASIHTDGYGYIDYLKGETRPAYIAPGNTTVGISLTDKNGHSTRLQPCSFESVGRHHYHIVFDVNGGQVGTAQLVITFDDTLTREDFTVDLTEELFTTPAPSITPSGFSSGDEFASIQGEAAQQSMQMSVMARGGIKSALLTFESDTYTPSFGKEVELCSASPSIQNGLKALGIEVKGFYVNPDQLGYIDLTAVASKLPVGRHTLILIVKDELDRASEPVSVTFEIHNVELSTSAATAIYGDNSADITVSYNGEDIDKALSFKSMNDYGQYVDAPITSIVETSGTRSVVNHQYIVTISLAECERAEIPVKMYLNGEEKSQFNIPVVIPTYSIAVDPYATFAAIKVTASDSSLQQKVVKSLQVKLSGSGATQARLSRDLDNGIVTLSGLTPETQYNFTHYLVIGAPETAGSFQTEAAPTLANGDFSSSSTTFSETMQCGGKYKYAVTYALKAKVECSEPTGWANLNQKTCWNGSSNHNTWFLVPSTLSDNGAVIIRSVAYDHAGETPSTSTQSTGEYYCSNAPASFASRVAGELFLGAYSYDGSEHRTDGISFSSRPTTLSFDYKYTSLNNEQSEAKIEVLDASGNVIAAATKNLSASASSQRQTITLPAYPFGKKAATLRVNFKSSTAASPATTTPTGSALKEGINVPGNYTVSGTNTYHALSTGSTLTIDNVVLGYELSSASKVTKRKKTTK